MITLMHDVKTINSVTVVGATSTWAFQYHLHISCYFCDPCTLEGCKDSRGGGTFRICAIRKE